MFQLTIIFFKALGFVKTAFEFLIKNPKILIGIVAIACTAYLFHYVSDIKKQVVETEAARLEEQQAKEKAIEVAAENQKTIERLMQEQALSEKSSKKLRADIKKDSDVLVNQRSHLISYTPTEDGSISKVLSETVDIIQESRKGR